MSDLAYAYAIAALLTFALLSHRRDVAAWWCVVCGFVWPITWAFVVFNCIYERMKRGNR